MSDAITRLISNILSEARIPAKTLGGASSGGRDRSGGRGGGYPVPMNLYKDVTDDGPTDKDIEIFGEAKKKKDEKDLGFGFNKDGYALQDKYDFQDMPISIENKKGSTRKWYDPDGKVKGSTKMHLDYGYIDSSKGYDGDEIDVYIGPDEDAEYVFVVHQNKAPDFTEYDEDKVMIGFASEEKAKKAYLKQYDDEGFYGGMSSMPLEKFKEKLTGSSGKKITNEKRIIENLFKTLFEADNSTDVTFNKGKQKAIVPPPADANVKKGVKQFDARTVILKNINKLKKRGVNAPLMPKMLGIGTRGAVFELPNNRVIKITDDNKEAVAANKIKTLGKMKYVYQVFDVFQFKNTNMYGIVQEKLTPLKGVPKDLRAISLNSFSDEAGDLMKALVNLNFHSYVGGAKSWDQIKLAITDRVKDIVEVMPKSSQKSVENFVSKMNNSWNYIVNFGIKGMFEELTSAGIAFKDYHPGNIMRRADGTPVIVDIGYSYVQGGQEPDVLEKKIKEADDAKTKSVNNQFGGRPDITAISNTSSFSDKDIVAVIKKFSKSLDRKGITVNTNSMLGHGSYGIAYEISYGGRRLVFKVTGDKTEAKASVLISGKNTKYLAKIYDVFQFKDSSFYGILQEKLEPLSEDEKNDYNEFIGVLDTATSNETIRSADWKRILEEVSMHLKKYYKNEWQNLLKLFSEAGDRFNFPGILSELKQFKIEYLDYHEGNIMKRGSTFVLIDLGASRSPGPDPDVLEKKIREAVMSKLLEGKANSVAAIVGNFQPFHKVHGEILRKLAAKNSKVIVFISGNMKDDKNPFSYEVREELLRASTPDIEDKIEVYKAETKDGGQTEYIPELIDRIIKEKNSTIEPDVAVNVVVGQDKAQDVKRQIDQAAAAKEKDENAFVGFDPSLYVVQPMAELNNGGNTNKVSELAAREALKKNNKEAVKTLLDPHILSDETLFNNVYEKLRTELGVKNESINEDLKAAGGPAALQAAAAASANLIKVRLGIDVQKMEFLGSGKKGAAFDVGGGKVLKITTDEKEAKASHSLEGKPTSRIARIFQVFKLKDKAGDHDVFIIEQEKVNPISSDEGREFDAAMKTIDDAEAEGDADGPLTSIAHGDLDRMYKFMRVFWAKEIRDEMGYPIGSAPNPRKEMKLSTTIAKREQILKKTIEKFNMTDMMDELKKNKIKFADYHAGNIGKRGSDYVVFDLGQSDAENAAAPPLLEVGIPASPTSFAGVNARVQSSPWSSGNVIEPDPEGDEASRSDSRASHDKLQAYAMAPKFEDAIVDAVVQLLGPTTSLKK